MNNNQLVFNTVNQGHVCHPVTTFIFQAKV